MEPFDKQREKSLAFDSIAGLRDSHFSDLTVKCGDKTFAVHKIIVSASSEWFRTALTGGFKEGSSREISLPDDDENDVSKMVQFCYDFEYLGDNEKGPLALHARMFALGEKYLMPSMQSYAASQFRHAPFDIADFATAVKECYSNSVDPKRVVNTPMLEVSVRHSKMLFGSGTRDESFRQMANKLPEYMAEVLHEICKDKDKQVSSPHSKIYVCRYSNCGGDVTITNEVARCAACKLSWSGASVQTIAANWPERKA